ncbi:hypothetical protein SALBM311S_03342 [Streptomyces alboniger]
MSPAPPSAPFSSCRAVQREPWTSASPNGRPFHDLDLASGRHVADHPCSADLYRGEFTVRDGDHWRSVWRVGGPAKDLMLTTDYAREV